MMTTFDSSTYRLDRRRFLRHVSSGAAAAAFLAACSDSAKAGPTTSKSAGPTSSDKASSETTSSDNTSSDNTAAKPQSGAKIADPTKAAPLGKRRLVVIEMDGGNDGLSTLVPYGAGAYKDLRKRTAIDPKQIVRIDDTYGVHEALKKAHTAGLAYVMGVGSSKPDGSHFAMMERWWRGDVSGTGALDTGFLGRLADAIGDPAARAVALSIGSGSHPMLLSRKAPTMSIPRADIGNTLVGAKSDDEVRYAFQQSLITLGRGDGSDMAAAARRSMTDALRFAQTLQELPEDKNDNSAYPGGALSDGLRLSARLMAKDEGIRIIHVPMGADFDTHDDHVGRMPGLLTNFGDSLAAFLADLSARGLRDEVLVMTTSEFGRTAKDNSNNGLDHGTASVTMLAGPVNPGLYGEYSSLTKLDENDDLIATMGFDQYYATVAESWFGVPAGDVLPGKVSPIPGIIKV
jgi:uncharacterized protein (DUF1501 family)